MFSVFLIVLFVSATVGNYPVKPKCPCDLLAPLYETFGCTIFCRRGRCATKYDCSHSPIIIYFRRDRCYFKGKYYKFGDRLPDRYPDQSGFRMCSYICDRSYEGPYMRPCYCIYKYTPPVYGCPFDLLYNSDYFHAGYVPVYTTYQPPYLRCPNRWLKPRYINYTTVLCANRDLCCQFGNIYIAPGHSFPLGNLRCTCMCLLRPKMRSRLACIEYEQKDGW